ncbi:MAG: hypothetical protein WC356_00805 [Candidatus Micrarchaeia archaeon]|jgi:hypothetical protein
MFIYFYDIITEPENYNKIKRRFYYYFKKSAISHCKYLTKSTLLIPDELEHQADFFFNNFIRYLKIYKIKTEEIIEL